MCVETEETVRCFISQCAQGGSFYLKSLKVHAAAQQRRSKKWRLKYINWFVTKKEDTFYKDRHDLSQWNQQNHNWAARCFQRTPFCGAYNQSELRNPSTKPGPRENIYDEMAKNCQQRFFYTVYIKPAIILVSLFSGIVYNVTNH